MTDRETIKPNPRRYYSCPDRMCGAEDCPWCRPGNFLNGRYVGDDENEEETETDYEKEQ